MAPSWITKVLSSRSIYPLARVLLTCMFWVSGFAKLFHFEDTVTEMQEAGLPGPMLIAALTILVQIAGSALVIFGGGLTWLGAGALGVFTAMAIIIAHPFWQTEAPNAALNLAIGTEHISMIGGLMLVSILAHRSDHAR